MREVGGHGERARHINRHDGQHCRRKGGSGHAQRRDRERPAGHRHQAGDHLVERHGSPHYVVEVLVHVAPHERDDVVSVHHVHEVPLHPEGVGVLHQGGQVLRIHAARYRHQRKQRAVCDDVGKHAGESARAVCQKVGKLRDGCTVEDEGNGGKHRNQHDGQYQHAPVHAPRHREAPFHGFQPLAHGPFLGRLDCPRP